MQAGFTHQFIIKALIPLLFHLPVNSSSRQVNNDQTFSRVPAQLRTRLVERFNLYMQYEHKRQCDKLYDMMDPEVLEWRRIQKVDKEDFIRNCQRMYELMGRESPIEHRVLKVEPWQSRKRGETIYSIKVVEKFRKGGKVFEVESICYAALKKGEWYLDHPHVQT